MSKKPFIPKWFRKGASGWRLAMRDMLSIYKCPEARMHVYAERLKAEREIERKRKQLEVVK